MNVRNFATSAILFAASLLVLSCARTFNPNVERGSEYMYRPGFPEVRFSAIGFLDEDNRPHINVASEIVYGSMIYKKNKKKDLFYADVTFEIRVVGISNDYSNTYNYSPDIDTTAGSIVYSQDTYSFERQIPVEPGEYKVTLTVIDNHSNKKTGRKTETFIPDPEEELLNLTNIRMLGKYEENDNGWEPITTYDIPGKIDSVKFVFQVTNNKSEKPLTINARLIRYEADTTAAWPAHYHNYLPSSLQYKGIDYDDTETIQTNRRVLAQPGIVFIEYKFPKLEKGNYRFEATTDKDEENSFYKARDFGIKSKNYPSVKSPGEYARPLVYLMGKKEYHDLMSIEDPDSLKAAVDRFWLKHVGSKHMAKSTIRLYYERVEEANKQFSNYKEGWKTDPGMMYILLGPPWFVDQFQNHMKWSYSYDHYTSNLNFLFTRTRFRTEHFPFNNFMLERSGSYFTLQYQQIELWLTGDIVTSRY